MTLFDRRAIDAMPQRYRANLINCIPGYKPALLVGSANAQGQSNLAIFSSVFHIGANPALLGMIVRPAPAGTERHTLENILNSGCFTLNHVSAEMTSAAHQSSARYPRDRSEFDATGLTAGYLENFPAPYVVESPIQLGLTLAEHQQLSINDTHLIIGQVEWINCPESLITDDGTVQLTGSDSQVVCGLDSYHSVTIGRRYGYAKPDTPTSVIDP